MKTEKSNDDTHRKARTSEPFLYKKSVGLVSLVMRCSLVSLVIGLLLMKVTYSPMNLALALARPVLVSSCCQGSLLKPN